MAVVVLREQSDPESAGNTLAGLREAYGIVAGRSSRTVRLIHTPSPRLSEDARRPS